MFDLRGLLNHVEDEMTLADGGRHLIAGGCSNLLLTVNYNKER